MRRALAARRLAAAALAVAAALAPGRARAPEAPQLCTVGTTPLSFGAYDPGRGADLMIAGNITFTCTRALPIAIRLDRGGAATGAGRGLRSGPHRLAYQVYLDPTATQPWGDGTSGTQFYSNPAPPVRTNVVVPFYGRIRAGQPGLAAGPYRDSIVVRIDY